MDPTELPYWIIEEALRLGYHHLIPSCVKKHYEDWTENPQAEVEDLWFLPELAFSKKPGYMCANAERAFFFPPIVTENPPEGANSIQMTTDGRCRCSTECLPEVLGGIPTCRVPSSAECPLARPVNGTKAYWQECDERRLTPAEAISLHESSWTFPVPSAPPGFGEEEDTVQLTSDGRCQCLSPCVPDYLHAGLPTCRVAEGATWDCPRARPEVGRRGYWQECNPCSLDPAEAVLLHERSWVLPAPSAPPGPAEAVSGADASPSAPFEVTTPCTKGGVYACPKCESVRKDGTRIPARYPFEDPISLEHIRDGDGVCSGSPKGPGHCYSAEALAQWTKRQPTDPLTQLPLYPEQVLVAMKKGTGDCVPSR